MTAGRSNTDSVSLHWCTPPKYVKVIKEFFGGEIALDPCSNEYSVVGANSEYRLPESDGLVLPWNAPTVFVNPPYGRDRLRGTSIINWFKKCQDTHLHFGAEVLALVPVATNTRHWKEFVFGAAEGVVFLYDTRLKFLEKGGAIGKGAPMACAMVYWGSDYNRFEDFFLPFGAVIDLRPLQGMEIGIPAFALQEVNSK